jgi:hypothetical protein
MSDGSEPRIRTLWIAGLFPDRRAGGRLDLSSTRIPCFRTSGFRPLSDLHADQALLHVYEFRLLSPRPLQLHMRGTSRIAYPP